MRAILVNRPTRWGLRLAIVLALFIPAAGAHSGVTSIPGALPAGFRYQYNDNFHGWPIAPIHREHPVRGAFLVPRAGGYHFGIDIAVDDRHPDLGAPPRRSHRVYALEAGVVHIVNDKASTPCHSRRLEVGHFAYWHVDATVPQDGHVRAGAPIGWTCTGEWHVHLSEWQRLNGTLVWVNPLHRHGKLAPYVDRTAPVFREVRFLDERQATVDPKALSGRVEMLAWVDDPESFTGWLRADPRWMLPAPPYRLAVTIRDRSGRVVLRRVAFQADQLPHTPFSVHYGPGTKTDLFIPQCSRTSCLRTEQAHFLRPLSRDTREMWDTRLVAPGPYRVTIMARDVRGNTTSKTITVEVVRAK